MNQSNKITNTQDYHLKRLWFKKEVKNGLDVYSLYNIIVSKCIIHFPPETAGVDLGYCASDLSSFNPNAYLVQGIFNMKMFYLDNPPVGNLQELFDYLKRFRICIKKMIVN